MSWQVGQPLFSARDRLFVTALYAAGVAICAMAWVLASGKDNLGDQVGALNLALVGGLVAGAGNVRWILRGRRALLRRRRYLLRNAAQPKRRVARRHVTGPAVSVVAGVQMRHFHRADCPMVVDRAWPEVARADVGAGRRPCGVCRP